MRYRVTSWKITHEPWPGYVTPVGGKKQEPQGGVDKVWLPQMAPLMAPHWHPQMAPQMAPIMAPLLSRQLKLPDANERMSLSNAQTMKFECSNWTFIYRSTGLGSQEPTSEGSQLKGELFCSWKYKPVCLSKLFKIEASLLYTFQVKIFP